VSKKLKKPIKPRKLKKKITEKTKPWKKTNYNFEKTDRFGFNFINLKPKKQNRTQIEKKPSKTEKTESNRKNRAKPVFVLKNQIEIDQFELVLVFLKKSVWLLFFDKNRSELKMITPTMNFSRKKTIWYKYHPFW